MKSGILVAAALVAALLPRVWTQAAAFQQPDGEGTRAFRRLLSVAPATEAPGGPASLESRPPIARIEPVTEVYHNFVRRDNYTWLRDESRKEPEVLNYLQDEADFFAKSMDSDTLQTAEIKRALLRLESPNSAKQSPGLNRFITTVKTSPTKDSVAYTFDRTGEEAHTLYIVDKVTNKPKIKRTITHVCDHLAWSSDGTQLFYAAQSFFGSKACHWVYRHAIGTDPGDDVLTYSAVDQTSMTTIYEQHHYLFLITSTGSATEIYVLRRDKPRTTWQPLFLSQSDTIATVNEARGRAIMRVVDVQAGSVTFYYISAPMLRDIARGVRYNLHHFPVIFRTSLDVSSSQTAMHGHYFVHLEEKNLRQTVIVRKFSSNDPAGYSQTHLAIDLDTRASTANFQFAGSNDDLALKITTSSPRQMRKTVSYNLTASDSVVVQGDTHPSVNMSSYVEELIEVATDDGVRIPVSLFYRRDAVPMDGSSPMLLHFYGFYGVPMARRYSPKRILLADQGFVLALAHVRGGGDLGTAWHEQGRLLKHKTTLSDIIRCMDEVVKLGYTSRHRLALEAGSAGGAALTAVANMAPGAFRAGIAHMPFTDILGSLLEARLAHTGWTEYGNPKNATMYEYLRSYSPYDNIRRQDYPHLLLTAGLFDSRVPYWDPAKFVAKLRAHKTDNNMLFLSTDMFSGHVKLELDPDYMDRKALSISFMFKALGLKWKNVVYLDASATSPMAEGN